MPCKAIDWALASEEVTALHLVTGRVFATA